MDLLRGLQQIFGLLHIFLHFLDAAAGNRLDLIDLLKCCIQIFAGYGSIVVLDNLGDLGRHELAQEIPFHVALLEHPLHVTLVQISHDVFDLGQNALGLVRWEALLGDDSIVDDVELHVQLQPIKQQVFLHGFDLGLGTLVVIK